MEGSFLLPAWEAKGLSDQRGSQWGHSHAETSRGWIEVPHVQARHDHWVAAESQLPDASEPEGNLLEGRVSPGSSQEQKGSSIEAE